MSDRDRKYYDEAFMEVFTNIKIVKSLLQDFVHEDWVSLIDFPSMEATKSVFKGIDESKKESDLLLKFKLKKCNPENIFIYVQLEFQSTAKPMSLRILEYLLRIYKKHNKEFKRLYPVIPIVIYNGRERWREDCRFINHFHIYSKSINKYIPRFEYILIDIARFDDKLLEKLKDSASYFFLLDKTDINKREEASKRIINILRELREADPEIFQLLGRYISGLLGYKRVEINEINEYIDNRGESMLVQSLDELYEDGLDAGIKKGIQQGLEQGLEQGKLVDKQETLLRLIDKKFGVSDEMQKLILAENNPETLNDALDIILFAQTVEEVISVFNK